MVTHWIRRNVWYLQKVNSKVYPNQVSYGVAKVFMYAVYISP